MSTTAKKTTAKKAPAKKAASRSGNPARRAEAAAAASSAAEFKKRAAGRILPLPSGLAVTAKRVDLNTFIGHGTVPNPLMEVVSEALEKGNAANVEAMVEGEDGKIDIEQVRDMYEMVNTVVVASVVEPKVHEVPEDPEDRDDDLLYVDEVDDEDKMFIFQWAIGGTDDIASFREQAAADLVAVSQGQGGGGNSK